MIRTVQFVVGITLLIALEILRVYFIMPFPGSQQSDSIDIAFFIHDNMFWLRTVGLLITIIPLMQFYVLGSTMSKWAVSAAVIGYLYIFFVFNYRLQADKMFYQPTITVFADRDSNKVPGSKLLMAVSIAGETKGYPIEIIGYHHQVRDIVGSMPVMITYCTVCRTGRAYSPVVNGKVETFRLVGMDHFNAMFEDASTGSWWRQVTGEAVAGPLKGLALAEIPSRQTTVRALLDEIPNAQILQPDSTFKNQYADLSLFDEGTIESSLERRDSASWKEKSWVVGVVSGGRAKAYDWNDLMRLRVVNDTIGTTPIVITLENDSATFNVLVRDSLSFQPAENNSMIDWQTSSVWDLRGNCRQGNLVGKVLPPLQSYQEFWHSWRTFHPRTTRYSPQQK